MEEKEVTIKEIFAFLPNLQFIFEAYERKIKYPQARLQESKEQVIEERDHLLSTVKNLNAIDLKIIFYLRSMPQFKTSKILNALQRAYKANCDVENFFK